ncbi:MAG: hypothetical protein LBT57_02480, partial [Puniceicoccales bacterium]|nr:hypothetical protein [Puniceicoccales bacterium]
MDEFRVRNTAALAAAIGADIIDIHGAIQLFHSSLGSQTLARSMASGIDDALHQTLRDKIALKVQSIKESIESISKGTPERGIALLNVLRNAETPVMTLLDELQNAPSSPDPVTWLLQARKLDKYFLKALGLREGMARAECREILSRRLESVLKELGIDSGIRSLCKLAIWGEDHYRELSSRLKLVSTIADGIANLEATLIQKTADLLGKDIRPDRRTKSLLGAAALLVVVGCACCPPLAVAIGILIGICLLSKAVSFLVEKIDENLVQSILKGQDPSWKQFFSDVFQEADARLADMAELAGRAALPLMPASFGEAMRKDASDEMPSPS